MSTRRKKRNKTFFVNKKHRKMLIITLCASFLIVIAVVFMTILSLPKKYFINYDGEAFTPQGLVIKFGDSVIVKNSSHTKMEFAIGSHENHRLLKGFEEKIIEANTTYTFTPEEKGIFDFHDHFNPKKIGVLIINE